MPTMYEDVCGYMRYFIADCPARNLEPSGAVNSYRRRGPMHSVSSIRV